VEGQVWQWPVNTLNPSKADMYMLSVSQEFPGRGKRALRAAVLRTDVDAVQARLESRTRELDGEVRAAYFELATARRALEIQRSALPLWRQVVAASETRYELGASSQSDVLAGAVTVSKISGELIELDEMHQLSLARLNTLMLREPDAPIGPLDEFLEPPLLLSVGELERTALEHHPDLAEARAMSDRASAMANEARGDLKADIRISTGFMFRPREGDAWLASVGFTWPKAPWARGKVDSRVAEASAEAGAAAARADAASAAIKHEVYESYVKANAARQRATLLRLTMLPQSRQAVSSATAAYQADKADFQTVLAQQQMLLESQLAFVRAVSDSAQAIAELERVVGSTVTAQSDSTK
jgi:cobalt-zinc-cadmium efflux system outer membrane protein